MEQRRSSGCENGRDLSEPVRAGAAGVSSVATLAGVVPEHLLDEGELVILAIKPSMWFILFNSAKVIVAAAVLSILWQLLGERWHDTVSYRTIYQVAGAVVVLQTAISFLHWLSRLYVLTNRRVMRIRGIFNIDVFEAPLTKIQNTYLTLALHERILALGSIQFATAGTGGIEAVWQNVNNPLEVHELVRRAIRQAQRPGGDSGP